jgi:hypothetical protein
MMFSASAAGYYQDAAAVGQHQVAGCHVHTGHRHRMFQFTSVILLRALAGTPSRA